MNDVIRYVNKETGKWESIDAVTGEVMSLEKMHTPEKSIPYSIVIAREICKQIRNGLNMKDICNMEGMPPYSTICNWKYRYPDFAEGIREAKKDAAQVWAEKAIEAAESNVADKIDLEANKLLVSTYQWMAEKLNPAEYGKQTKITGDATQPLTLVVNTGIQRGTDDEPSN